MLVRLGAAYIRGDLDYLIRATLSADPDEASVAAEFLGESGDSRVIEPLVPLLRASDPFLRATAATSLGKLQATSSATALTANRER
jgi:HEAT repeat protein